MGMVWMEERDRDGNGDGKLCLKRMSWDNIAYKDMTRTKLHYNKKNRVNV